MYSVCFSVQETSGGCRDGSIGLSLGPSCDARNGLSSVLDTGEKGRMEAENGKGVKITRAGTAALEELVPRGLLREP